LNRLYRTEPALHRYDCEPRGFRWVDGTDAERSVIAYLRLGDDHEAPILCVFNFTPVVRYGYALGVPLGGRWVEVLNTDAREYGGSGVGNLGGVDARDEGLHGMSHRLELTLPPLACVLLRAPV
jgi:1,4-alpha-glucan branching enzyme